MFTVFLDLSSLRRRRRRRAYYFRCSFCFFSSSVSNLPDTLRFFFIQNARFLDATTNKTGGIRKIPLMRVKVDDAYVLVGSMGGQPKNPSWVYNLRANPDVDRWLPGEGTEVTLRLAIDLPEPEGTPE